MFFFLLFKTPHNSRLIIRTTLITYIPVYLNWELYCFINSEKKVTLTYAVVFHVIYIFDVWRQLSFIGMEYVHRLKYFKQIKLIYYSTKKFNLLIQQYLQSVSIG